MPRPLSEILAQLRGAPPGDQESVLRNMLTDLDAHHLPAFEHLPGRMKCQLSQSGMTPDSRKRLVAALIAELSTALSHETEGAPLQRSQAFFSSPASAMLAAANLYGRGRRKSQTKRFGSCVKSVRKTVKARKGSNAESAAIAICTTTLLHPRGRTIKRYRKGRLTTQTRLR